MTHFDRLSAIDPNAKAEIRSSIRRHSVRAEAYGIRERIYATVAIPFVAIGIFAIATLEAVVLFNPGPDAGTRLLLACAGILLVEMILNLTAHRLGVPATSGAVSMVNIAPILLAALLGLSLTIFANNEHAEASLRSGAGQAGAALTQASLILPTAVAILLIYTLKLRPYSIMRIRQGYYPDVVVVGELLLILIRIGDRNALRIDPSIRRELMNRLESAANSVHHGLPRQMSSGDRDLQSWLAEETAKIAAALRYRKRLLVSPDDNTLGQFTKQTADDLVYAAKGEWTSMNQVQLPDLSASDRLVHALSLIKSISFSVLPFACLVTIQRSAMAIEGALANYLKAGAILWGLVTFLRAFDPQYMSKITAVKDVVEAMRSQPEENE
jgi:hypothetical protein